MVQFNFSERTIKAKVVYYGPAQSGKTTNLEQIHRITDPVASNRLISLNTAQDRTLFFDLLPFSLGAVNGYDFKIQLYTVPGQVQYNATRRVVLAGADAVVFVADSRRSSLKENVAAFENMKVNLLANRLVPEKVPLALQYNKQDLPDLLSVAELDKALNPWARRAFPAVAARGDGVIETFAAIVQDMLQAIAVKYNLKEKGLDPASVPDVVAEAFKHLLEHAQSLAPEPSAQPSSPPEASSRPAQVPGKVIVSQQTDSLHAAPVPGSADAGLVSEELLHRSIRSNVELAEALSGLVQDMNVGLGTILSHAELLMVYREDQREKKAGAINAIQQEASRLRRIIQDLGNAGGVALAGASAPSRPSPPAKVRPAGPPRPAPSSPPPPAAPPVPLLEAILRDAIAAAQSTLDSRGLSVEMRMPPSTTARCPPQGLTRALVGALQWIALATPDASLALRCERKPVLLRSKEGEVKRDFLMLTLGNAGILSGEEQQQIVQGANPAAIGQAVRAIREMGGFLRFAPLPGGGLETRVFLPAG